jgi:hypothetical protein
VILALGFDQSSKKPGADYRFMRESIIEWADLGLTKVRVRLPDAFSSVFTGTLKDCGFIFEGISTCCGFYARPRVHLSKHFLYETLPYDNLMEFLRNYLLSLGYEIRDEDSGFGYRLKTEYRLPFIFSGWHRIMKSGSDIIMHPPARVLEPYELETLFYPLQIEVPGERPLLMPMERKRAESVLDIPERDSRQAGLFDPRSMSHKIIHLTDITYNSPPHLHTIRRGLPLLFYINRVGAVGTARVDDWHLDEPKNLFNNIDDMAFFDPEDVKEHAATTGPQSGKVMVIRYRWYQTLNRIVSIDEIRRMDDNFNPQRTRSLSPELYKNIVKIGSEALRD